MHTETTAPSTTNEPPAKSVAAPKKKATKAPAKKATKKERTDRKAARKANAAAKPAPKAKAPAKPAAEKVAPAARQNKGDKILEMVARPGGATLEEIMTATGWQAHSVRGYISTAAKKGNKIRSEKVDGKRTYRAA